MGDEGKLNVVIVGGGTAGWMAAAALVKLLPTRSSVTLVESEAIGIVGVGEATLPHIRGFNEWLGINEAKFMAATRATFKLGIEFRDWARKGDSYIHPFGAFGRGQGEVDFHHYWSRLNEAGAPVSPIGEYSMAVTMAYANRFALPDPDPTKIESTFNYAYQFDATLFAPFLRGVAEGLGAKRIEGRIIDVELDGESGNVAAIRLENGERVDGDLFIDCSGFVSLIIGRALNEPFEDWSKWLPCDRAVAMPCQTETALTPYTSASAMDAGWRWRIPLQHRVGNGYVFSSRFQSPEAARETLLSAIGEPLAEPRLIRFTPGRRKRAWIGNVVAIGLSSGFLEPLESTSLHLIQTGIGKLLSLFPRATCDPLLAEQYDRIFEREMEDVRDFLVLHYHHTEGRMEPMWRHCQATALPETLAYKLAQFRGSGRIMLSSEDLFRDASWFAVMTGQGVRAQGFNPMLDAMSDTDNLRQLEAVRAAINQSVGLIPRLA